MFGRGGMSEAVVIHLTPDQLTLGLPEITSSPQDDGVVEMLVVRPVEDVRVTPETVEVSSLHGIHGDHWSKGEYREMPDIQVAIINSRLLDLVSGDRRRWSLAGDNVVADLDLSQGNLVPGQKVGAGSAVLGIS